MSDSFGGRTVISSAEYLAYLATKGIVDASDNPPRKHKYGAVPVVIDGIRFASTAEGNRYEELKRLRDNGEITDLVLQPRFPLTVNGEHCGFYVADFSYYDIAGSLVVEDVKGLATPVYRLKKKLVKAIHGIEIQEVR